MASRTRAFAFAAACLLAVGASACALVLAQPAAASPGIGPCPVFPSTSHWNQRVDTLPVLRRSNRMIRALGPGTPLHPDFGSGRWQGQRIGIPFATVSGSQQGLPVRFSDAAYSDNEPYPIPPDVPIEDRPDRHALIVDLGRCRLYELYQLRPLDGDLPGDGLLPGGLLWAAGSGATWDLRSAALRPNGWTSADAAGLPIFPGLVRYDEVRAGEIRHALRVAVPKIRNKWVYPARHAAGDSTNPSYPAFGQRLRLKRRVNVKRFPRQTRPIVRALQRYGMLIADHGPWHLTGAPNEGWDMNQVFSIERRLKARDFEFVDTSSLPRPAR
jgi:hypothetical protein